jgi:pimeloyl-ACP methyl ester carboxylesterase
MQYSQPLSRQRINTPHMKILRRFLLALLIFTLLFSILPFLIPIQESGVDPQTLITDPAGRFITLQGVRLYVEEKGPADGPPIILLHGLFGSTETWRDNVDALAEAGWRVINYDRPGYGLSDKPEDFNYSVPNQADLTMELLTQAGIPQAVVLGHSAGANVAAHIAVRHPERVMQLVLVDAAVLSGGPPAFVSSLVSLPPVWRWGRIGLQAFFTRDQLAAVLRGFYVDTAVLAPDDLDVYWRAFQTPGWDVALLALTRDLAGSLLDETTLRTITVETLLLWGDQDTVTPLTQGEQLATFLPNSRLEIIPNTGHQPFEEQPAAFNAALLDFINATQP